MNHAFHRSDLGALADTSGNPSRFTADTEPACLHVDEVRILYPLGPLSEREKTIKRKPRKPLCLAPIDDLQGISNVWEAPRRTVGAPRAQRESSSRMFADGKWSNLAVATALVAAVAFLVLALPNFRG